MARKRDRIIALSLAILFFGTSFAVSFAVIYQLYTDNKEAKTVNEAKVGDDAPVAQATPKVDESKKLEGKPMAGFTPIQKIDKLEVIDLEAGTGEEIKAGDTLTVDYTGAVAASGMVFQSSLDAGAPATFPLGGVIKGWQEGVPGMKVGGTRRILIPAAKAYGENPPSSSIPVNADLVFDITVIKIGG